MTMSTTTSHDGMTQDPRPDNTENDPDAAMPDQDTDKDYEFCELLNKIHVRLCNVAELRVAGGSM